MYYDPSGHFGFLTTLLNRTFIGSTTRFVFNAGKQFVTNGWSFDDFDWGSAVNSLIVVSALGLSLTMGVGVLGPAIAGAATTSLSALGYSVQEWLNGRTTDFGKTMMYGGFVMLEGMVNFGVGGIIGSIGYIGIIVRL